MALYELSYSLYLTKDYKKSVEIAYKGAQYKSEYLSQFYVSIGNGLDMLGESKKAVDVFKQGIKIQPDNNLLYYNIAYTYSRLGDVEETKKNYKRQHIWIPTIPALMRLWPNCFKKRAIEFPPYLRS
mgnify:CR=1 FL=1